MPDNSIVAGIPAKILRIRSQEEINDWHVWVLSHGGIYIDEYNLE